MFPRLERFLLGPKFACVEAEIRTDKILFHVSILQKKGSKAQKVILKNNFTAPEDVAEHIDRRVPVALIVTGRGIINRMLNGQAGVSDESLIRQVLPNALAGDLLISKYEVSDNALMVSVARRETVKKVADSLEGISIVSVLVGPSVALTLVDLVGAIEPEWNCGNHSFRFQNGRVNEAAYVSRGAYANVSLGDETIPALNTVSFAGALQGLTFTSAIPGEVPEFNQRRAEFIRMKRYGAAVKTSVLVALLVLLVNFFVFAHLRELKSALEADPRTNTEALLHFNELTERVEANKEFFAASGWSGTTSYAWMADQLAAQMPDDIVLTRMNVAPAETFNREDTLGFHPKSIVINGTCRESASLNAWLKILQQAQWVSSAVITAYTDGGGQGKFELHLEFR